MRPKSLCFTLEAKGESLALGWGSRQEGLFPLLWGTKLPFFFLGWIS